MSFKNLVLSTFLVVAGLSSIPAMAALPYSPFFSWTLPTQNVDGSTIPATGDGALQDVRIYCAKGSTPTPALAPKAIVNVPVTSWQSSNADWTPGDWSCVATATNNLGEESAPTNALPFTIAAPVPTAPNVFNVQ